MISLADNPPQLSISNKFTDVYLFKKLLIAIAEPVVPADSFIFC